MDSWTGRTRGAGLAGLVFCAALAWSAGAAAAAEAEPALAPATVRCVDGVTRRVVKCYPGGRMRAYCVGFDDGNLEPDRRVAASLRRRGMKGTFFLNARHPQSADARANPEVYAGHEVASHGANHRGLGNMTVEATGRELGDDRDILGKLFGQPVDGHAYPYGDVPKTPERWRELEKSLADGGFIYARMTGVTSAFRPPENFYRWVPDCGLWVESIRNVEKMVRLPDDDSIRVLMEFTHSRDIGTDKFPWTRWEEYLDRLSGDASFWNPTLREFVLYVAALRGLAVSPEGIVNADAKTPVWILLDGRAREIPPGGALRWEAAAVIGE